MSRRGVRRMLTGAALIVATAFFGIPHAAAQETGTIRGSVLGTDGSPVGGAQVSIPEREVGTLAGTNGVYELDRVPPGTHTVMVQSMGYRSETQEVQVAAGEVVELNFTLAQSAIDIEGVVVTALGISRDERGLGYAVDNISGQDLSQSPIQNVTQALAGKAAGLEVKHTGALGGSTSVVLRGFSSISGSNQVLFIVDGVPMDNSSRTECNTGCGGNLSSPVLGRSGVDYGNAMQDINPNDIESVTVLKGANAAALYGSRASNGVVLITTKKGRDAAGFQIEGNTGVTWSTPLKMPTFQNEYGGGQTPEGFRWVDGAGAGFNDATDESWGPPLDGTVFPQFFGDAPFLASPYSPRSFFETGLDATSSVSVSAAGDGRHVRFSATRLDSRGLVPNGALARSTFNLAGGLELSDRIRLSGAGSYMKTEGENRPVFRGYPGGMGVVFSYWQRQVDIDRLRDSYFRWMETGEQPRDGHPMNRGPNWNHNFFDSPFYTTHMRRTNDTRDRLTGHVELEYQINDWLSAMSRVGTDWGAHRQFEQFPISLGDPAGAFINRKIYRQETNAEALLSADFGLSEEIRLTARMGGNVRRNEVDDEYTHVQRLLTPGVYNVGNAAVPPNQQFFLGRQHVNSVFGLATVSYRDMLFFDVTGRSDWSSTLPPENNSYFYPSFSSSLVFTDAFQLPEWLSYGQIRGSWAKVGSDAEPYQLRSTFVQGPFWGSTPSFTHPNQLANRELRPEETVSIEIGTDLRFADDRASLDVTHYRTNTRDQILPVDISHTTGYAQRILNAGEVQNKGLEVVAGLDILRNPSGLSWNMTANWAMNRSEVLSLTEGLETIILGNSRGLTVEARVGERYGAFMGQTYARDEQGRRLIGWDGRPIPTAQKQLLGHFEPDWVGGLRNTFSFAGVDLSFLLDARVGGQVFCQTCMIQQRTGLLIETLEGRDDFQIVYDGVLPDGTPNNIGLDLPIHWRQRYIMFENGIHDASHMKLREMSLGFAVPAPILERLPVSSGRVSIVGRDLLLFTDVPHIDPELNSTTGNAQGMELFQAPNPRSFGVTFSFR